ncbi:HDL418Cp [Eremothecium sinecaudum]|uniref:HDL418Cp n=1 Tax=Eremothecium sinecaudum TaxID=45286 RepID=A0A120K237_9SACH|nr:HDL418Cp [Eremothecium sinecaudum]AMD20326.1 HDL418Cp [Eremothecium sinecaudum]
MATSEREFISNFLTLAFLDDPALPNDYHQNAENLDSVGISLRPLKIPYENKRQKGNDADSKVVIILKSVRPPKFVHTVKFSKLATFLQVKESLRALENDLQNADIKFLLKGKVLNDLMLVQDLNSPKISLTVMVGKEKSGSSRGSSSSQVTSAEAVDKTEIAIPWEKIQATLSESIVDQEAVAEAFSRLKRGWELAK